MAVGAGVGEGHYSPPRSFSGFIPSTAKMMFVAMPSANMKNNDHRSSCNCLRSIFTVKRNSWKKSYLRILTSGLEQDSDAILAAELIDAGYGKGNVLLTYDAPSPSPKNVIWQGTTAKGRLFADELEKMIWQSSWRYRILMALSHTSAYSLGLITPIASAWLLSYLGLS